MIFLECSQVIFINQIVVEKFGGLSGLRDGGLLDSAIANPKNLYLYNPSCGIFNLAASYCISIIKNHAFLDGNKRTAFTSMDVFLSLNNVVLNFPEVETVDKMVEIATNNLHIKELALWLQSLTYLPK